jgi:hypothetical protein
VVRNEADPDTSNNEAVLVLVPNVALSVQLQAATDFGFSSWQSGGDELWLRQTNVTHDGVAAAQSGPIIHDQQSWIRTTVRGPGTLNFWWKVSSEAGHDGMLFYIDTNYISSISGNVDWQKTTNSIASGLHYLTWYYVKDDDISAGSDTGWLDQVTYSVPPFYLSNPSYSNAYFYVTLNGTNGQQLTLQSTSDLLRWSDINNGIVTMNSTSLVLRITTLTNVNNRSYRAAHKNQ